MKDQLAYLTVLAKVSELKDDDGDALLYRQYEKADFIQECEGFCERNEKVAGWHKFKSVLFYGVFEWKFYRNDTAAVITYLQSLFYVLKL